MNNADALHAAIHEEVALQAYDKRWQRSNGRERRGDP